MQAELLAKLDTVYWMPNASRASSTDSRGDAFNEAPRPVKLYQQISIELYLQEKST